MAKKPPKTTIEDERSPTLKANFDPLLTPEELCEQFVRAIAARRMTRYGGGWIHFSQYPVILRMAKEIVREIDRFKRD